MPINIFDNPGLFRRQILNNIEGFYPNRELKGKGMACVFLTRFCPVSCDFCFFQSLPQSQKKTIYDAFNPMGMNNLINFINKANISYLLVSGGGDPFAEYCNILKLLKETNIEKAVLVTSGYWAKDISKAKKYLIEIAKTAPNKKIVLRLSYDQFHLQKLDKSIAFNLLNLFQNELSDYKNIEFKMHSMINDTAINDFLNTIHHSIKGKEKKHLVSDSTVIQKIMPYEDTITFHNGFSFSIGYANRFFPDPKIDMRNNEICERNLTVFNRDIQKNEHYNSSVVENMDGTNGLDFWINYNGNVCSWGNQVPRNIFNLYFDNYDDVIRGTFNDPISLSYIEKGSIYRDSIIQEVSPKTVLKAKLINIRDYVGAILFEEDKIQLYYTLRVLQDMNKEKRLSIEQLNKFPPQVQHLILSDKGTLLYLYNSSDYDMVDQFLAQRHSKGELIDFLELINLGHYEVSNKKSEKLLQKVNSMYELDFPNIRKVSTQSCNPYNRRLIPMKECVNE